MSRPLARCTLASRFLHWTAPHVALTRSYRGVPLVYDEGVALPLLQEAIDLFRHDEEPFAVLRANGMPLWATSMFLRPNVRGTCFRDLAVHVVVQPDDQPEPLAYALAHEVGHLRLFELGIASEGSPKSTSAPPSNRRSCSGSRWPRPMAWRGIDSIAASRRSSPTAGRSWPRGGGSGRNPPSGRA